MDVAASTTASPYRSPGDRVVRSNGPDTLTAARICPDRSRTGADTDATPASRSSTLATQVAPLEERAGLFSILSTTTARSLQNLAGGTEVTLAGLIVGLGGWWLPKRSLAFRSSVGTIGLSIWALALYLA